jgi:hypothetical protein
MPKQEVYRSFAVSGKGRDGNVGLWEVACCELAVDIHRAFKEKGYTDVRFLGYSTVGHTDKPDVLDPEEAQKLELDVKVPESRYGTLELVWRRKQR